MIQWNWSGRESGKGRVVEICMRVPGNWKSFAALHKELKARQRAGGYKLAGGQLLLPGGRAVYLRVRGADGQFPAIFRLAASRPLAEAEFRAVERAPVHLLLAVPAGNLEAAQQMIGFGKTLLDAGGCGIFLDTGARSHAPEVWRDIAEQASDPACLAWAYTTVVQGKRRLHSVGMHALGQPDAEMELTERREEDFEDLSNFLAYLVDGRRKVEDGHFVGVTDARYFYEVTRRPDRRVRPSHPMHNPYGVWQMVPLQTNAPSGPLPTQSSG